MSCKWWIMPTGATSITFTVDMLDIESEYDYLRIYTCTTQNVGTCSSQATLWGNPGQAIHFPTWQTGIVMVQFESDGSVT
eukprot:3936451-Rhodomonas_salina.1